MADKKSDDAKKASDVNRGTDPEERKIEAKRIALKIPSPDDYKTSASRQALYRLNMKNATKDSTPADMGIQHEKDRKANPFVYKKGGRVKKGGMALVHTGERVLTKAQQKSGKKMKKVSHKR